MKVGIFISCCIDQFSPQTGSNFISLLQKLGVETHYNYSQTCCGQILYKTGDEKTARQLGEHFISLFSEYPYVVGCSASCVSYIKSYFEKLFVNSVDYALSKKVVEGIHDITDFLVNVLKIEKVHSVFPFKVVFMDNCAALRQYGIRQEPRILLKNVSDIQLLEMSEEEVCCGYGGISSEQFEPISSCLAKRKIENALFVGAEYIVSTDSSCLLHLQSYIDKHHFPVKCIHLVDILSSVSPY